MTTTDELVEMLERVRVKDSPAPSTAFVERLEATLLESAPVVELDAVRARPRPTSRAPQAHRMIAIATIGSLLVGSAAAAAAIAVKRNDTRVRTETPATTPESVTTASSIPTAVTTVPTPSSASSVEPAPVATTAPANEVATSAVAQVVTTTVAATPDTTAVTTPPVTTSRVEGTVIPATITLTCTPTIDGTVSRVSCAWSAATAAGVTGYRVLRSVAGETTGRAFMTGPGDRGYTDTSTTAGIIYRYMVQAIAADGSLLERSDPVAIAWP